MRTGRLLGAAVVVAIGTGTATGQIPGAAPAVPAAPVPTVPGAPVLPAPAGAAGVAGGAGGAAGAAAAPPRNIWSFFMVTPEQKAMRQQKWAMCRAQFCQSRIGGFVNNMLVPAAAVSGGLVGPICPDPATTPNAADLAKPATTPEGAAARIKQEEAQAAAKIAAIEYLGTVDCRYYPEAEAALIVGLRAEKNECVRLAAAKALASGCCCTAKIVKALTITLNCSTEDGFPAEASELVRAYAYVALQRCMQKCVPADDEPPPEPPAGAAQAVYLALAPDDPASERATAIVVAAYFDPDKQGGGPAGVYDDARRALAKGLNLSPNTIRRLSPPQTVRDAVMPGYVPGAAGGVMTAFNPRELLPPKPTWIKTIPDQTPEPAIAPPARAERPPVVLRVIGPVRTGEPVRVVRVGASEPVAPQKTARGSLREIFQAAGVR